MKVFPSDLSVQLERLNVMHESFGSGAAALYTTKVLHWSMPAFHNIVQFLAFVTVASLKLALTRRCDVHKVCMMKSVSAS